MKTKLKVFLCHSSHDKSMVREVYKRLVSDGFDPWLDEEKLLPGQDWNLEIERAVEKTDTVIVFLSSNSISKEGYIQRELRFVLEIALEKPEGSIFIIPVRLQDCEVPRHIRSFHYVDFFPETNQDSAYNQISNSLRLRAQALGKDHLISDLKMDTTFNNEHQLWGRSYETKKIDIIAPESLSNREVEIASLIAQGASDREISRQLNISISAIKHHAKSIMTKLGCSSRSQIILWHTERKKFVKTDNLYITISDWQVEFIRIPTGNFMMGSTSNIESDITTNEQPQHRVSVSEFYVSKSPITNRQYHTFVEATNYELPEHWVDKNVPLNKDQHPVVNVSWEDAYQYCKWLSRETNRPIRLPTEAEWEKASRGLNGQSYSWGNQAPNDKLLNFNMNIGDTTPIGNYSPQGDGPFGLTDTCGNVWEWCLDWYKEDIYKSRAEITIDPKGPENGSLKSIRGGAFHEDEKQVRCTTRFGYRPNLRYYGNPPLK